MNLLVKITELVDQDIAGNHKLISMMGIIVPWLPFIFFVKGSPSETHPFLAGLALGASFG